MDFESAGYYCEKLQKAKFAMKPIVKALHEHREPNIISMISLIREMKLEGADSLRIKNILKDGADYSSNEYFRQYQYYALNDYSTNDLWEEVKGIINKLVDYQFSLGNGRGMRM